MSYLDHAAATPLDNKVLTAMQPFFSELFYNPSAAYAPAIEVRRAFEDAKATIAHCIGAKPDELVMTAGATESIQLAVDSVGGHVVIPAIEHHAVLAAVARHDHTIVPVQPNGSISVSTIEEAVRDDTRLISVALANNELGTIQPLREVAEMIKRVRQQRRGAGNTTPLYLHTDASQGVGQIDIHLSRLGVDLMTLNAGKIYGPKQVGVLWADASIVLSPVIVGGGQERGLRSGTENVAGAVGFAMALQLATKHRQFESTRLAVLRDRLQTHLMNAFPDAVLSGNLKKRLSGHLHISFPGIDAERIVFALEARGVLVASGSACAANKGTRSHVLTAIGLADEVADGSLRLTLGKLSTDETIAAAADVITEVLQAEYERVRQ